MILSLADTVRMMAARRLRKTHSRITLEELVSAAWLGAIQAVDRFRPELGMKLGTFARWRIAGEMSDYLRSLDYLGRDHRREVRRGVGTAPILRSIETLDETAKQIRDDRYPHPLLRLVENETDRRNRSRLTELEVTAGLSPREIAIVERTVAGETQPAIGLDYAIGYTRVAQIYKRAVEKLRAAA